MSSRPSQIIVLCEDKLHEVFARRFLRRFGFGTREIHVPSYPEGRGAGESFVRQTFAAQLEARRSRSASTVLIAIMDADALPVAGHHRELDEAARKVGLAPRSAEEPVIYIVPKWHIQSWLACLSGVSVDAAAEDDKKQALAYEREYGFKDHERDAHPLVDVLATRCQTRQALAKPPPSLVVACEEFERIREILRGGR